MGEALGSRIKAARQERGLSQAALAARLGVTRPAVTQWEGGRIEPDSENLRNLAAALDVDFGWLAQGDEITGARPMPVKGAVEAGSWREANGRKYGSIPVAPHPAYPPGSQYALIVHGSSMNRLAAEGDFLHVVDIHKGGIAPKEDDVVVVERRRHGFVETTVKRLKRLGKRYLLQPESDDPQWQEELAYDTGDEDTEVRVIAIAIGRYTPFDRRPL